MISDAIDILDARVINVTVSFEALVDPGLNRSVIIQNVLTKLQATFNIKNFHVDQPIVLSDVNNTIYTTPGVIGVNNLQIVNIVGTVNNKKYSSETYDITANTRQGIIFPPSGGIFEVKYPEIDIVGRAA